MSDKLNTFHLDTVAENGISFRVVVLVNGKSENFSTASLGNRTLVEFYDRRYDFTPDGQFVSRYYLDTMLEHSGALNLHGGVDNWTLDSVTFRQVRSWLQSLVDSNSVLV